MALNAQLFRTTLPAQTVISVLGLLAVLGSLSGASAQGPMAPPAAPATVQALPAIPVHAGQAPGAPIVPTPALTIQAPGGPAAGTPVAETPAPTDPKTVPPATAARGAASAPPAGASTQGSMQIQDLLASLARFDQNGRDSSQKLGFEMPERAVNEYLAYSLRTRSRPGISAITVTLLSGNNVSAVVEVDFDAIKQWNPELLPEPLRPLLTGKKSFRITAHFESRNSTITVSLKDAQGLDGKPLANKIMIDLFQAIGGHQPESYDTASPMPLPFGLKRVWTEKQAVLGET